MNALDRLAKNRATCFLLAKGFLWNPLCGYPRNKGCFCGSGEKAKRCCIPFQPRSLPEESVLLLKKHWADLLEGKVTLPPAPGAKIRPSKKEPVVSNEALRESQQKMLAEFKQEAA